MYIMFFFVVVIVSVTFHFYRRMIKNSLLRSALNGETVVE